MAKKLPIVLVHGYSDKGSSFARWCEVLQAHGYDTTTIHLANYVSLSNEITVKDIAEGFDRALRERAGLSAHEPFDAIVHSTGMLVIREWLTTYSGRSERLKHLIGLAPATFGSPMAHKGRSWLGAIFKGGRELGPDFMEAGDLVLSALELGSKYTWDLAHRDLLDPDTARYGPTSRTPYPFIFIGTKDYGWLRRAVTEAGTDGTVRWAGAGFNARKVKVDLTLDPSRSNGVERMQIEPWKNVTVPFVLLDGLNHATILQEPSDELVTMVKDALAVASGPAYEKWRDKYQSNLSSSRVAKKAAPWQQFVTRAIDERGDGIDDYFIQLGQVWQQRFTEIPFDMDVHAYREDESYRCFHVNLAKLQVEKRANLALRIIASSGTELVAYHGYNSFANTARPARDAGKWDAVIEFDPKIAGGEVSFFAPFTTTLVEIRMNREPMPLQGVNKVLWFADAPATG
jgi:hypothetical protein